MEHGGHDLSCQLTLSCYVVVVVMVNVFGVARDQCYSRPVWDLRNNIKCTVGTKLLTAGEGNAYELSVSLTL